MSIEEIVSLGAHKFDTSKAFDDAEIVVVENDVTDILNVTQEIEALYTGKRILFKEDAGLQQKFWEAGQIDYEKAKYFPQPSVSFLKRHSAALFSDI